MKYLKLSVFIALILLMGCSKKTTMLHMEGQKELSYDAQTTVYTPVKDVPITLDGVIFAVESGESGRVMVDNQRCEGKWFSVYVNGNTIVLKIDENTISANRSLDISGYSKVGEIDFHVIQSGKK